MEPKDSLLGSQESSTGPYAWPLWIQFTVTNVKQQVVQELAGETEVVNENLHKYHSVHHKFHVIWPGTGWVAGY